MRLQVVPRLITFDVTGTLLMTKIKCHYIEAAINNGYVGQLDDQRLEQAFVANFKRLESQHPIYGRDTGLGWENWWRNLVHDVFRNQDRGIDRDKLDKIADSLIYWYSTNRCWHKYPGTIELLESLSRRNVVLGVISNFDDRLEAVLDSTSLRPYFSFVLTSYKFGIEKPSPAIFQEALRLASAKQSKRIKPNEAIHVGDKLENDYLGARSAGWNAILLNRENKAAEEDKLDPRDVLTNFQDLKEHFESVLA